MAAACPRWCCLATSPAPTPTPSRAPPARSCALPTRAAARASSPPAPRRARSSGSTAPTRHTNAFKINEDVVIPLPRMAEYTDGIERINIELSLRNKISLCDALSAFFQRGQLPLGEHDETSQIPSAELLEDRVAQALALV